MTSIPRTSIPIWSPSTFPSPLPLLATGTVSGALDASFSSDSLLELWAPFAPLSEREIDLTGELVPVASLPVGSRFNRLAWGYVKEGERNWGVLAAGLENGEIGLWDPEVIMSKEEGVDPLIARYDLHKGPVRGLDFNQHQTNVLASGATNGEIYIWDLTTPNKPFSPGARSRSLEDITALQWNSHVAHVLATGSNSGYTVVWDLKAKREVTALSSSAGALGGQGLGPQGFGAGNGWGGGKKGVSAVQWHPNNPTKIATASDDDSNPVIMLWDLRNWKEPEKVLSGHDKGILSLSWCAKDSDLLISSGKDGRTITWNPSSGDIVAEVTPSSNWSFDVQWCPRNPSIISTASLDGKISITSIQQTTLPESVEPEATSLPDGADGANLFDDAIRANAANYPTKSLTQAPKWLQRPSSVAFGFGGKLISISNKPVTANGVTVIVPDLRVQSVVTQPEVVERALRLDLASEKQDLGAFCESRTSEIEKLLASGGGAKKDVVEGEIASWKLLETLFKTESKEELVRMLGFEKEEVRKKVEDAVRTLKGPRATSPATSTVAAMAKTQSSSAISGLSVDDDDDDDATSLAREPLVTFADTPTDNLSASSEGEGAAANLHGQRGSVAGSDFSTSLDSTSTKKLGGGTDSEVTEPSLFGDDATTHLGITATGQQQAAADFYSQIGSGRPAALPDHVFGRDAVANSSVAATIGSASSVASVNLKPSIFKIYPADESDHDKLITKALIMGDFDSAVQLALSTDRYADAILFAVRGGPDLLARTQKAYFEKNSTTIPYLRVFESIVSNDLGDVVQNADLANWQEIFVVLCTYSKAEEFPALAEQLGQRLEYQYSIAKSSPTPELAPELRKNAILCYLAAGLLEKVVGIWIQQMKEDEEATKLANGASDIQFATAKYEAHAKALQTFVEKVTVFQHAVGYVDTDLNLPATGSIEESGARTYKLAALYERYVEYAELLAAQGLVSVALKYIAQTPADFQGVELDPAAPALARERLARANGQKHVANVFGGQAQIGGGVAPAAVAPLPAATSNARGGYQYPTPANYDQRFAQPSGYAPQQPVQSYNQPSFNQNHDDPYGGTPASNPYAKPAAPAYNPYAAPAPVSGQNYQDPYANPAASTGNGFNDNVSAGPYAPSQSFVPAPPVVRDQSPSFPPPRTNPVAPPPSRMKTEVQWNDAPVIQRKATPAATAAPKPNAITTPFPNMPTASPPMGYASAGGFVPPPPPSRGSSRTPAQAVPPPPGPGQQRFQNGAGGPPIPTMSPPPASGCGSQPRFNPAPPPPPGPPRPVVQQQPTPQQQPQQQQQQGLNPNFPPPPGPYGARPAPAPSPYAQPPPPQPQQQAGPRSNGPPGPYGAQPPAPTGPYAPQQAPSGPYAPPANGARPPGPPTFNGQAPPARSQPSPAPAPAPPKVEPPKPKYPPGDRTHIPEASKPIFNILSNEIRRLRQVTPPQQAKMISDTEKRMNILFDMLNCETLSAGSVARVLEIVKAIEARNQAAALDLHLQMLTSSSPDIAPFQAAIKLVIQRMQ